jgi:hypothetical protein
MFLFLCQQCIHVKAITVRTTRRAEVASVIYRAAATLLFVTMVISEMCHPRFTIPPLIQVTESTFGFEVNYFQEF